MILVRHSCSVSLPAILGVKSEYMFLMFHITYIEVLTFWVYFRQCLILLVTQMKTLLLYFYFSLLFKGIPDLLLLWRAVLKRIHKDLRREVKASRLVIYMLGVQEEGPFLSEDDEDEIEAKEKAEGRRKAVDLLLLKLMQLKRPGWHQGFLTGLTQETPKLVPVVKKVRDDLLKEKWFSHMSASSPETQNECTREYVIMYATNGGTLVKIVLKEFYY